MEFVYLDMPPSLPFFLNFTLQYCIGFAIHQHESTTGVHMFPILNAPSPYHLSGSSQCTSPKHPVSCIEPRVAIHFLYDIIHVSMPFSQVIPPSSSPSPTESKRLFYTSGSLLLSHIQGIFGFVCNVLSRVWFFAAPWTIAHQPPLPTEFSRQQYWSRCRFLLQGSSWPRIEPGSPKSLAFLALVKFCT